MQDTKYILEKTEDGSISFINTEFNESYHSIIGAYKEALHKHVLACKIEELTLNRVKDPSNREPIKILDVCFGLGYNSGVAMEKIWEINPDQEIEIIGLESDLGIIQKISELEISENYENVHKILTSLSKDVHKSEQDQEFLEFKDKNINIKVLIDDARNSVKSLAKNYFDAVFFDPFSPKSCPVLWTEEFIKDVVSSAKAGAYISTYSSSRLAKDGFKNAACELFEGPKLNRRNGGVLARKN
ncbi:MAG: hypothetical protein HRT47_07880 [Candidatus Caenarcaniphilales bacterium]|nr:hypothetical protein [Candidatus Caenarcaniphilales bacterium]